MKRLAALALALLPSLTQAADDAWRFRVFLDRDEIGTHDFVLKKEANGDVLTSAARYRVKVMFVEAYRYEHASNEHWRNGCLTGIDATTDDNGKRTEVRGRRDGDVLAVNAGGRSFKATDCVMTFAYWNPAILERRQLLNVQTGELQDVTVSPLGEETLSLPTGPQRARRHSITTRDFRIDVWYAGNRWVALESRTSSGKLLRYVPR